MLNITWELACRDDCLDQIVPSDLRRLLIRKGALELAMSQLVRNVEQHIIDNCKDKKALAGALELAKCIFEDNKG